MSNNHILTAINRNCLFMNFQTVQPNVYDAIAGVHQATIVPASRFGCGFLGFNRIFLLR